MLQKVYLFLFLRFMQEKIEKIKSVLQVSKNIVITVHKSPDGDALGSALALYGVLSQLNYNVKVVSPNSYASFLHWMKGNGDVLVYSEDIDESKKVTLYSDMIFMLDYNHLSRIGDYSDVVRNSDSFKVMIDHHQDPDSGAADIIISDTSSCSTAQLLFSVIEKLGYKNLINKDVAECLYSGIVTDTGSFKFSSTTSKTHKITAQLIDFGADNSRIHNLIYDNYSLERAKLLGYCLNEKMKIFQDLHSAIISLTDDELKSFNFRKGDTEGVVNYALAIKGIKFAVFIAQKDGVVKLSLRSKGDFKVNEIAKKYFSGGGHINAAGGTSNLSVDDTIKKVIEIFKKYKTELLTN